MKVLTHRSSWMLSLLRDGRQEGDPSQVSWLQDVPELAKLFELARVANWWPLVLWSRGELRACSWGVEARYTVLWTGIVFSLRSEVWTCKKTSMGSNLN